MIKRTIETSNFACDPDKIVCLTIYIDCMPVKGVTNAVLYEDFIRPFADQIAKDHGVPSWQTMDFGKGKALLANAVRAAGADKWPPVLIVGGYAPGAHEVLEVLIPHVTVVVRALKG